MKTTTNRTEKTIITIMNIIYIAGGLTFFTWVLYNIITNTI